MSDFWVPQWKWQLVDWLTRHFNEPASKFKRMKKNRLYAIYIKVRKGEVRVKGRGYEELVCRGGEWE